MKPVGYERPFGRLMQALGLALIALSTMAAVGVSLAQADPAASGAIIHAVNLAMGPLAPPMPVPSPVGTIGPEGTPSASPEPSIVPTATPSPPPIPRGGPLTFAVTGSLGLGKSYNSSSQSSINTFNGTTGATVSTVGQATSTSSGEAAVGMAATVSRHTAGSTLTLQLPLGIGSQGTTFGQALLTYSRPKYQLSYGNQQASIFGVLPPSSVLRGLALTTAMGPGGELTYFGGPALGANGEMIDVAGILARRAAGLNNFEYGLSGSSGGTDTPASRNALLGFASSKGALSLITEGDLQQQSGDNGAWEGFAYGARIDDGIQGNTALFTMEHNPEGYLVYGAGAEPANTDDDLGIRRGFGRDYLNIDLSRLDTTTDGSSIATNSGNVNFTAPISTHANVSLTGTSSLSSGSEPTQWLGLGQFELGLQALKGGFEVFGFTLTRNTTQDGATTGGSGYSAQIQQQLGGLSFNLGEQENRLTSTQLGLSKNVLETVGVTRTTPKTSYGLSYTITRIQSLTSDATTRSPLITIARRLSPALDVQTQFGTQSLVDPLNPASNGRSKIFNIQISAPFAFGNGAVQGRVDPRLPGTITGRVVSDTGNAPSIISIGGGGIGNVALILDGKYVQRTDLSGAFQFSFVQPGPHQLRVDPSSIPRGLTVDQPVVGFTLEGGQTAQYYFRVGNYGSIGGHVFGRDESGNLVPLQAVLLRVDGGTYSQTDPQGNYGFGRLSPGEHTVEVIESSVPAFATFPDSALKQKAVVQNGQTITLNFEAEPLGSISGKLTFDPSLGRMYTGGVNNAYVVAEPGEYAAITTDDGTYIIDNLPPGTYTVSVDPETLPDQTGQLGANYSETVAPHQKIAGADFVIGHLIKKVVFSFLGGGGAAPEATDLRLNETRLPPQGMTLALVSAPESAKPVTLTAFGNTVALTYDAVRKTWTGDVVVPADAKDGQVEVTAHAGGKTMTAELTVSAKIRLATLQIVSPTPQVGQYVAVRGRFLIDVGPGDRIVWDDGQVTTLGKPVSGRVFSFSVHLTAQPLRGTLIAKHARIAVSI